MAGYKLTRNQAFPDHDGKAGEVIEVENPSADAWKDLIDAKVLVPVKDEKPADDTKSARQTAPSGGNAQPAGDKPTE